MQHFGWSILSHFQFLCACAKLSKPIRWFDVLLSSCCWFCLTWDVSTTLKRIVLRMKKIQSSDSCTTNWIRLKNNFVNVRVRVSLSIIKLMNRATLTFKLLIKSNFSIFRFLHRNGSFNSNNSSNSNELSIFNPINWHTTRIPRRTSSNFRKSTNLLWWWWWSDKNWFQYSTWCIEYNLARMMMNLRFQGSHFSTNCALANPPLQVNHNRFGFQ